MADYGVLELVLQLNVQTMSIWDSFPLEVAASYDMHFLFNLEGAT